MLFIALSNTLILDVCTCDDAAALTANTPQVPMFGTRYHVDDLTIHIKTRSEVYVDKLLISARRPPRSTHGHARSVRVNTFMTFIMVSITLARHVARDRDSCAHRCLSLSAGAVGQKTSFLHVHNNNTA